jgi:hypothetical protein
MTETNSWRQPADLSRFILDLQESAAGEITRPSLTRPKDHGSRLAEGLRN